MARHINGAQQCRPGQGRVDTWTHASPTTTPNPPEFNGADAVHTGLHQRLVRALHLAARRVRHQADQLLPQLLQAGSGRHRKGRSPTTKAGSDGGEPGMHGTVRAALAPSALPAELGSHIGGQAGRGGLVKHEGGGQLQAVPGSQAGPAGRGQQGQACC